MSDSSAENDWIARASATLAFYAAIVGATLAGQAVGIAIAALAGARSSLVRAVLPYACSVALEGLVGARAAGRRLEPREAARISIRYSIATVVVTAILVGWTDISHPAGTPRLSFAGAGAFALLALLAVVAGTAVRAAMLSALSRRGS